MNKKRQSSTRMTSFTIKTISITLLLSTIGIVKSQIQLNLQQSIDYALQHTPDVQQSLLEIYKNRVEQKSAYAKLLPSAQAGYNQSYSLGSTINPANNAREAMNVKYDQYITQANIDLFTWKNYLNIGLKKLQKEGSEYRAQTIRNAVKMNTIILFFNYQKTKSWTTVLEEQVAAMEEQIQRTEKEVEIGSRPKSDIYDIRANFASLTEQWISAKNEMQISKLRLLAALNKHQDDLEFIINQDDEINVQLQSKDAVVEQLVKHHPAYLEMIKNKEIAYQKIKMSRADYLPTLSAQYQWSTFYSKNLKSDHPTESFPNQLSQNKNQQIAIGINIPIFQQFQVKNNIEFAKIEFINTTLEGNKQLTELYKDISIIAQQWQNASERYAFLNLSFENQKKSYLRSAQKYEEGLIDAYSFFVVKNNWLQANYNLISSQYDLMQQSKLLTVLSERQ